MFIERKDINKCGIRETKGQKIIGTQKKGRPARHPFF
jgi:hypothetical protein